MQKISRVVITNKKKNSLMTVVFNKKAVGLSGQPVNDKWTRESDQLMSRDLSNAVDVLIPHLLFGSKLIGTSIDLDENMDYEKWFAESHYNDDERFEDIYITQVKFIGTEALDAVKIYGYKLVEWNDRPFKVKIETPVINLDRVKENHYPLVSLLDTQVDTLLTETEEWLERGKTATQGELAFKMDIAS